MHPDISDEVLHKFFASLVLKTGFFFSLQPHFIRGDGQEDTLGLSVGLYNFSALIIQ